MVHYMLTTSKETDFTVDLLYIKQLAQVHPSNSACIATCAHSLYNK